MKSKADLKNKLMSSFERTLRWHTCQQIGVLFFHSALSNKQVERYKKYFEQSDFIKSGLPEIH